MQVAAGRQPLRERVHERGLQQAPLVMALLGPRIGEDRRGCLPATRAESCARRRRRRRAGSRARWSTPAASTRFSSAPTPGPWTSRPRKSRSGCACGDRGRRLAHAEADLQDDRRDAAERGAKSSGAGAYAIPQPRQQHVERALSAPATSVPGAARSCARADVRRQAADAGRGGHCARAFRSAAIRGRSGAVRLVRGLSSPFGVNSTTTVFVALPLRRHVGPRRVRLPDSIPCACRRA